MNRVRSNIHAVKKNLARSLSQLELLQSVACVDDNSPTNKKSYPYSVKELVEKEHGDVKIISDADFDERCHTGKFDVDNSTHGFR